MNTGLSPSSTLRSLWRASFWVSFPFGVLAFILPIYGRELGASAVEIGGFFSALSLMPVIIRPFLGRILDRWGRRPFFLLGLVGYCLSMLIFTFANTIALLTVARFIQGIGQAFLWLSIYTIIADLSQISGRGRDFGIIDEAASRGGLIGTTAGIFAYFLMLNAGLKIERAWMILFVAYIIPTLIALREGWRGVDETVPRTDPVQIRSRPITRQLMTLMAIVLITSASSAMVWPLLMIFLQDRLQAGVDMLAIAYFPAALLNSFLPSRLGGLADRFGRKRLMSLGLIIGSLASVIIPSLGSLIGLAILWGIETIGYCAAVPAERAFVADIAGKDVRGASYGLYTFAYFLGAFIGPIAGGWLYDRLGHASPFYLNASILLLGAAMVMLFLREPTRISTSSEPSSVVI
jgi:DHA1 family multidrug resistance protein-like MFS transporter